MFWAGRALDEEVWRQEWEPKKPAGASLEVAGKSTGMVLEVPVIDPLARTFDMQVSKVREALEAAKQLLGAVKPSG